MVDMKVLVVEDDQTLLSVLQYNLKKGWNLIGWLG